MASHIGFMVVLVPALSPQCFSSFIENIIIGTNEIRTMIFFFLFAKTEGGVFSLANWHLRVNALELLQSPYYMKERRSRYEAKLPPFSPPLPPKRPIIEGP